MGSENRKKQKDTHSTMKMLTLITQFGINMLVPIFLCFFLGRYLDQKLGTSYITIILFFVGALAGFRNVFVFANRMMKTDHQNQTRQERDGEE